MSKGRTEKADDIPRRRDNAQRHTSTQACARTLEDENVLAGGVVQHVLHQLRHARGLGVVAVRRHDHEVHDVGHVDVADHVGREHERARQQADGQDLLALVLCASTYENMDTGRRVRRTNARTSQRQRTTVPPEPLSSPSATTPHACHRVAEYC